MTPLDPYSTSQKLTWDSFALKRFMNPRKTEKLAEKKSEAQQCIYHAPFFAWQIEGSKYGVSQGNCHHWDCPRCGVGRAKTEYWRIVNGCAEITKDGSPLWFITITTRGAGLSVAEAEEKYLLWTNRLLSRLRYDAKRTGSAWCYVQVTERQKRRHPHSHVLTTYKPDDLIEGHITKWRQVNGYKQAYEKPALRSEYLQTAVRDSGLGEQYDISEVRSSAAVSRYVGKYLFKSSLLTVWPKDWRRVRYSQNWPKLPEETKTDAMVLITKQDWYQLATIAENVRCRDEEVFRQAEQFLWAYPVKVSLIGK